ncbi:hypothetical protein K439DRAFT_1010818 [Ramaria rubella]|nr:hypothetical protein K439DRAFT_1010818 [Ramaria rubella]
MSLRYNSRAWSSGVPMTPLTYLLVFAALFLIRVQSRPAGVVGRWSASRRTWPAAAVSPTVCNRAGPIRQRSFRSFELFNKQIHFALISLISSTRVAYAPQSLQCVQIIQRVFAVQRLYGATIAANCV